MSDQLSYMTAAAEYGPLVSLPLLFQPYVLVFDPVLIQKSLAQSHTVMCKDRFTHELSRVLGQGLVTSEDELWRKQRKLVSHAFIPRRIGTYADAMVAATHHSLDGWSEGQEIPIHKAMAELTLDIVGRTLFDADVRGAAREVGHALEVINDFYALVLESPIQPPEWWPSPGMFRFRKSVRNVDRIIGGIIEARVHEETVTVLGDRRASSEDYPRLEHTERAIKESMRLYPPVYAIGRELLEDFELGGYTLNKGDTLLFVQWVTHRSADCFENPLSFDPDRWLPERAKAIHKYAYFPFGGGPRICIGNHFAMTEAVLVLATLIRQYRFELLPDQTLELQPAVTLRAAKDLQMRLVSRQP